MNKSNALAGLIGNYGDSDDESEDGATYTARDAGAYGGEVPHSGAVQVATASAAIHPAPIPHCGKEIVIVFLLPPRVNLKKNAEIDFCVFHFVL